MKQQLKIVLVMVNTENLWLIFSVVLIHLLSFLLDLRVDLTFIRQILHPEKITLSEWVKKDEKIQTHH